MNQQPPLQPQQPLQPPAQQPVYQGANPQQIPAGYKRQEQQAKNHDVLQQKVEEMSTAGGVASLNPKALEEDREILGLIVEGNLDIPGAVDGYVYKWVQCRIPKDSPGMKVREVLTMRIKVRSPAGQTQTIPCWERVEGNMPECPDLKDAEGSRVLGDTLLVRCKRDVYVLIEEQERKLNKQRAATVEAGMVDTAQMINQKAGRPLIFGGVDTYDQRFGEGETNSRIRELNQQLKDGSVPGLDIRR